MKANELRIGNWISYKSTPVQITDFIQLNEFTETSCEPIPLTEQWLKDFGFEEDSRRNRPYYYMEDSDIELEVHGDKFVLALWAGETCPSLTHYIGHNNKYVHQLQNLYFALTGEELTKK